MSSNQNPPPPRFGHAGHLERVDSRNGLKRLIGAAFWLTLVGSAPSPEPSWRKNVPGQKAVWVITRLINKGVAFLSFPTRFMVGFVTAARGDLYRDPNGHGYAVIASRAQRKPAQRKMGYARAMGAVQAGAFYLVAATSSLLLQPISNFTHEHVASPNFSGLAPAAAALVLLGVDTAIAKVIANHDLHRGGISHPYSKTHPEPELLQQVPDAMEVHFMFADSLGAVRQMMHAITREARATDVPVVFPNMADGVTWADRDHPTERPGRSARIGTQVINPVAIPFAPDAPDAPDARFAHDASAQNTPLDSIPAPPVLDLGLSVGRRSAS